MHSKSNKEMQHVYAGNKKYIAESRSKDQI